MNNNFPVVCIFKLNFENLLLNIKTSNYYNEIGYSFLFYGCLACSLNK